MDVFALRDRLIKDYASYVRSFINIRDQRIGETVEEKLADGVLWPEPLIQLNPSFERGAAVPDLVERGVLHETCGRVFALKPDDPAGAVQPLQLHRHQLDAIEAARTGDSYVLTTGTGSGKSLAYILPIVDFVLRNGPGQGIKAIVVYPMNALANSQAHELDKFINRGFPNNKGPVRFALYTGQAKDEQRQEIIASPPDIILTNYVMLELLLTRPYERRLVEVARGLRFLVLDELHTYRGRQGADVAMLCRRVREACHAERLQCIGTSATLASGGSWRQQRETIASLASRLFGGTIKPERVIGETLQRATQPIDASATDAKDSLRTAVLCGANDVPEDYAGFLKYPLASWIENTLGLSQESERGLVRAKPRRIRGKDGVAAELAALLGIEEQETCAAAIERCLLAGYACKRPETGMPTFAFRVHQFISRGNSVYASLEPASQRYIGIRGQQYVPGDRTRVLLPLAFCRECGQEYYVVERLQDGETATCRFLGREVSDHPDSEDTTPGFLYFSEDDPWPGEDDPDLLQRIPEDWIEPGADGTPRVKRSYREMLPAVIRTNKLGLGDPAGLRAHFVPAPFRFCLHCGVSYGARQTDMGKLSTLASGGRSTATTTLCLSAVRSLREDGTLPPHARKVLSFTDNRQDASLQAGHFNDFIEVGLLRSGIYNAALRAGPSGLDHAELAQRVFEVLNLDPEQYASNPEAKYEAKRRTESALKDVLGYRVYCDLKRGWRVTSPNLEQCGLLEIRYESLDEIAQDESLWRGRHPALVNATPSERHHVCKTLLDFMRRSLAIKVSYLDADWQERLKRDSSQQLTPPWALDDNERLFFAPQMRVGSQPPHASGYDLYLSPRGGFGQFLRRPKTFASYQRPRSNVLDDTLALMRDLTAALTEAGLVEQTSRDENPGYRVQASSMRWVAGDGTKAFHDPIRVPRVSTEGGQTNRFFVEYYRSVALTNADLRACEHTAAVRNEDRELREEEFRSAKLPLLFCSPTMELGVDIAQLNAVNLRNIPPTPANYAQRSGRAGRSGQPALVFSYCTTGSPHDQYFFNHPELMVCGAVSPPRLDLANEDLVRAHAHAVWLATTGAALQKSLSQLLDMDKPNLPLLPVLQQELGRDNALQTAKRRLETILGPIRSELSQAGWWTDDWLELTMTNVMGMFDSACTRWRTLYQSALAQFDAQHQIMRNHSRPAKDKEQAERLHREAKSQLDLLTSSQNAVQDDFYSYRYFASEGFLPGYSFPRLPLSAYIPARRSRSDRDEFLSRPRFLAISEFGPRALIYHEGVRYRVSQVMLPASDMDERGIVTRTAKQCQNCGYLHFDSAGQSNHDLCERCETDLNSRIGDLFRLQNVSTRRVDRISSDEEERQRQGFDLRTGVRFVERAGRPAFVHAEASGEGESLAKMDYGSAATIWRINLGWRRRKNKSLHGFTLDVEHGYWAKNNEDPSDEDDPLSRKQQRVIPYVEDHRNVILFEPQGERSLMFMASLQAALKSAIEIIYQLEDNELAVEPLPSTHSRKLLLIYEAAEGGAGVLRRVVEDPGALAEVARKALELLHFDPATGEDKSQGENRCESACYDCLMGYWNQLDHQFLDRASVRDYLLKLAGALVQVSSSERSRSDQYQRLVNQSGSELERSFLRFLYEGEYRLPSDAQRLFEPCSTRPDFIYDEQRTVVYVDGPPHQNPQRRERDALQTDAMEDCGWTVMRADNDDWAAFVARYPSIFGGGR